MDQMMNGISAKKKMKKVMNQEERVGKLIKALEANEPAEEMTDLNGSATTDKTKPYFMDAKKVTKKMLDDSRSDPNFMDITENGERPKIGDEELSDNDIKALNKRGKANTGNDQINTSDMMEDDENMEDDGDDESLEDNSGRLFGSPKKHAIHINISLGRRNK